MRINSRKSSLLALLGGLLFLGASYQQQQAITLHGRVLDGSNNPVAGLPLSLHEVTNGSGKLIGTAKSNPDGTFEIQVPGATSSPEAVFFIATRYNGETYLGQPFRPPLPTDAVYEIHVGAGGVSATELENSIRERNAPPAAQPEVRRELPTRTVLLIILGIAAVLGAIVAVVRKQAPAQRAQRRLYVAAAKLDEDYASGRAGDPGDYERRRQDLLSRLRKTG